MKDSSFSCGDVVDYVEPYKFLFDDKGPFLLLRRITVTSTWEAIDLQKNNAVFTIVPTDTMIYKRIV